ncbi:MAG TPA: hydantoinase/oxoprolinase N-terminal domain-containing protein, partial [Rubrobacter sp.]|nr:hydantoinase/oxoprolinase N-terminal domain-containing protein [Rubrobacter sp.]
MRPTARTSTRRNPRNGSWSPSSRDDHVKDLRLGVDVGGTFTDLVALGEGRILTAKVPSTPSDQSEGAMNAIDTSEVEAGAVVA